MRYCSVCRKYLDDNDFVKNKRGLSKKQYENDGFYKSCNLCRKEKNIYSNLRKKTKNKPVIDIEKSSKLKAGNYNNINNSFDDIENFSNNLKEDLRYSLMSDDIIKCLPDDLKNIKIHKYNEIDNFENINELLNPCECCIILYVSQNEGNVFCGHWTCLLKTVDDDNNKSINFFDSYGIIPDDEKKYIDKQYLDLSNQKENTLTKLLYNECMDDSVIEYNEKPFQKMSPEINVCGRHCVFRLWFRDLSMNNFQKFMEKLKKEFKLDYDDLVTKLTNFVLVENQQPEHIIELIKNL